jgi:energy-coupling factor transporter ATP-binding protein EcfA2
MAARLSKFEVIGLFGRYNNTIRLNLDEHVTAIIGPNGTGKTVCLRLIEALFRKRFEYFSSVSFDIAEFTFDDGHVITINRDDQATGQNEDEGRAWLPLNFSLSLSGETIAEWRPRNPVRRRTIAASRNMNLINLTRVGPDRWWDGRRQEHFSTSEVEHLYAARLPDEAARPREKGVPSKFVSLTEVNCRLIETQRLLMLGRDEVGYEPDRDRRGEPSLVVRHKAAKLREMVRSKLAEYAFLSQRLDGSFPRRVIEQKGDTPPDLASVGDLLNSLETERRELERSGILSADAEPLVIPGQLDTAIGQMLSVYIDDTKLKFGLLTGLRRRIDLFCSIISDRFIDKDVRIDRENGFEITSRVDGRSIPLGHLSSGEQHQLILTFELIFEMEPNSLILIDEPELSLHVGWQKKFIGDLMSIIKVNPMDVIMATHSPQLIGRWSDLVVELGNVED